MLRTLPDWATIVNSDRRLGQDQKSEAMRGNPASDRKNICANFENQNSAKNSVAVVAMNGGPLTKSSGTGRRITTGCMSGPRAVGPAFANIKSTRGSMNTITETALEAASKSSMIHQAILGVMEAIGKRGIAKMSRNKEQGYDFRGIEAAMNQLAPILKEHGITISARYSDLQFATKATKSGGEMRFAVLKGLFKFEADDGTFVESEYYGEGADSLDKAVTKAQSVAYRTALFQQFIVPTMAIDPETGNPVLSRPEELEEIANAMIQKFNEGNDWGAFEEWKAVTDSEEMLKIWSILRPHSKLRAAIKKLADQEKAGEKKGADEVRPGA